jgi:hypothetical protein
VFSPLRAGQAINQTTLANLPSNTCKQLTLHAKQKQKQNAIRQIIARMICYCFAG